MNGEILSEVRKDNNLSQKALAAELHVSENTVSGWERNISSPDDETKIWLAKRFNVSLDYLFGLTKTMRPLENTGVHIITLENLPEPALKETMDLLEYIKNKYHLKDAGETQKK